MIIHLFKRPIVYLILSASISVFDRLNFEKFIAYQRPNWRISTTQRVADNISFYTLLVVAGSLFCLGGYSVFQHPANRQGW